MAVLPAECQAQACSWSLFDHPNACIVQGSVQTFDHRRLQEGLRMVRIRLECGLMPRRTCVCVCVYVCM